MDGGGLATIVRRCAVTVTVMLVATLVGYMVVLLLLGVVAARRTRDESDFFLGGRRSGALLTAIGASASSSSAWTLLGVSGAAYAWGLSSLWLFPACVGGFALNWFVMAPALRRASHRSGAMTVPDLLVDGEGGWQRATVRLAALITLFSLGAYIAAQFLGAGKLFQSEFGLPLAGSVAGGAAIILLYTLCGGFAAVSLTDTLQGLVMALTAFLVPVAALVEVGGVSGLLAALENQDIPGYLSVGGPRAAPLAVGFIAGLLGIGLGYPGQPHVVKYYLAVGQDTSLRRARTIAMSWAVIVYAGMLVVGLCARALFPEVQENEVVLAMTAERLFHPAIAGVMLAAVLSAVMSTADSQLLVASSTVAHDLRSGKSAAGLLQIRLTVVVLCLVAAGAALIGNKDIFDRVLFGWAAMGAAFGPLLIVRVVLGRRLRTAHTFIVMLCGFALSVAAHFYWDDIGASDLRGTMTRITPFAVALLLGLFLSVEDSDETG